MAKLSKANAELFADLLEELNGNENAVVYLDDTYFQPLAKLGLVEFNTELTDENHNIATRLTTKGKEQANMTTETAAPEVNTETLAPAAVEVATETVDIASAKPVVADVIIPIPEEPKKSRRGKYPFMELPKVGASFFIPATPKDKGDMARRIKQRASEHNKEQREQGTDIRFIARTITDGAPWGEQFAGVAGAAVWRVTPADVDKADADE